jgi:hypothetical protein
MVLSYLLTWVQGTLWAEFRLPWPRSCSTLNGFRIMSIGMKSVKVLQCSCYFQLTLQNARHIQCSIVWSSAKSYYD